MNKSYLARFLIATTFLTMLASAPLVHAQTKVTTNGGLKVTSGEYEFKLGGRIMYDYNRAQLNGVVDEDQFDVRRARLFVSGKIAKNWSFKTQFNTDGSGAEDLYLRYTGFGSGANVTVGKQKVPFSLEEMTSSKDISVLERSAVTEQYALGRAEGVQLHGKSSNTSYGLMVFTDDDESGDENFGVAGRFTWAPVKSDTSVVHLGVAAYDVDDSSSFGIEAAATHGPFHIQAEYADGDSGDNDINAFYIQAGYIFTGESRPYSGGIFKRVKPANKGGAIEAVVRYEDGDGNFSDIELGRADADAITLGLNWYAHNNVRLGVNYTDGSDAQGNDGDEFRVRFQLTF